VTPLVQTPFSERNGEVSPDGRWLAYDANDSGGFEIYVRPFPDVTKGVSQVSTDGGTRPLWARNGQELFYMAIAGTEAAVVSVRVERGATWKAAAPTKLFAGRFFFVDEAGGAGIGRTYDVSLDGQRFLMIKDSSTGNSSDVPSARFVVVQNWFEELKRLVPTK
jgi:eukaryotic-like serine/threonine-protein kinase